MLYSRIIPFPCFDKMASTWAPNLVTHSLSCVQIQKKKKLNINILITLAVSAMRFKPSYGPHKHTVFDRHQQQRDG